MRLSSPLAVILMTVFLDLVGFGIIIPLQPFYVEAAGGTGLEVGLLFASYSLAQFLFVPIWGRLSDRVGRRPVILLTLVGTGLSFLLFAAAGSSLWLLFVARSLSGICGANIASAQAYIADITAPEERARGMGLIGAAFGLGFIMGPAIGGGLSYLGPAWPPLFAGVLALANAAVATWRLPESLPPERRQPQGAWRWFDPQGLRAARARPELAMVFGVVFLATLAFSKMETTFALLAQRNLAFDRGQAALLFVYIGAIAAVVQGGLIGRLAKRFGSARLMVVGTALLCLGLLGMPQATTVPQILGVAGAVGVGMSLNRPSMNALVSLFAGESRQGAVLGASSSLSSLARAVGPAVGGWLWDQSFELPYLVGAGLMALAVVLALKVMIKLESVGSRA